MPQKKMFKENAPTLGLDLDGCITDAPEFFSAWSHSWPGKVFIITYRRDRQKAINDLAEHNIKYDEVILVDRFDGKAAVIADKGVTLYVDDQPEMLKNVPYGVNVMLFRNQGNFDFEVSKWIMSSDTCRLIR
jgi:uncharacterized HAD superfamily protein